MASAAAASKGSKKSDTKTEKAPATPPAHSKNVDLPATKSKIIDHDAGSSAIRGKPDPAAYNAEQEEIKKEIDALNVKLTAVKDKIGLATKGGSGNDKRTQLRAELDQIRSEQGDIKGGREKLLAQVKSIEEDVKKKVSELQAKKGKSPFKTTAEVDARVKQLEAQVESGSMKVLEEKRALAEINTLNRQRKTIEAFQSDQDAIDALRSEADELRKDLNNPETKALSEKYDTIKKELDDLKKEADDAYNSRNVLFEERDGLQKELDALYTRKRESAKAYREANDKWYAKQQEDRVRRAERAKAAREAAETEKKKELVERLRDEADAPAYQAEIEDCQTLIDFFSGNVTTSSTGLDARASNITGIPELNLRTVEADTNGLVELKKDEDDYFVASKKPKKGSKINGSAKPSGSAKAAEPVERFSVPLAKLSALASLSIPPPVSAAEVPQTIENLRIKKEWLTANQERKTAENKAEAERKIAALLSSLKMADDESGSKEANEEASGQVADASAA
ncbi:hypothetical protein M407DRAFT_242015 [Tulasnella calospora MUT 4182]|uniref:Nuclear segregation protein Bfr1 n=1 Tax=Tulasnella calospora MUT 4182 TaxID=1051891 RepID=A0A0C3MB29_9AGAM|nr:hypothetical protein M407DRAFT_242015 [Tulasnella calospora MUT 4182]